MCYVQSSVFWYFDKNFMTLPFDTNSKFVYDCLFLIRKNKSSLKIVDKLIFKYMIYDPIKIYNRILIFNAFNLMPFLILLFSKMIGNSI